jgi:hypothetical protein
MMHGCSVAGQRLRGQLGPLSSVLSAGSVGSRDIKLDEELGHVPTLRLCAVRRNPGNPQSFRALAADMRPASCERERTPSLA